MSNNVNNYQRWFVFGTYQYSGAPKLETDLYNFARERYLYTLVYETDIDEMLRDITAKAELLHRAHKNCKPVDVRRSKDHGYQDNSIWLYMGAHALQLRKVKEELEIIPNDNILQLQK